MPYITTLYFLSDADSFVLVCVILGLGPGMFWVMLPVLDKLLVLVVGAKEVWAA